MARVVMLGTDADTAHTDCASARDVCAPQISDMDRQFWLYAEGG